MANSKRIAKNTLMLYFRQILIMMVSLYTVRVILNVLGAEDYGIYNVIAGVVVLFSFVNSAMATSTQRFFNYTLGEKDINKTKEVYSASILIHIGIALLFLIIAETGGLWFVKNTLNIPSSRHDASLVVYQLTILTTVFNIIRVPYNALIIAYEKMSFFAFLSILETVLKLALVYLLSIVHFDKLIIYALLLTAVSVLITFIYIIYCKIKIESTHFIKLNNKTLIKELIVFSSWNLFGATANVANQQGTNIVLNIYTNVTVNTAMGIANQINTAVYSFVSNFQTAFNPQLVKSYAADEMEAFDNLLIRASKISFFLLLIIVVPLYNNLDFIILLWLKTVPEYTIEFVKLILICSLIESLNGPLWIAASAEGNIKTYQIITSILIFLNLPLCIVFLYLGFSPVCTLYIRISINFIITIWRLLYLKTKIKLNIQKFFFQVILPCLIILLISVIIILLITAPFSNIKRLLISLPVSIVLITFLVLTIGLTKNERRTVFHFLKTRRNYE